MEIQKTTKLNSKKFEGLFGDWWKKIEPFLSSGGFDPIYDHLRSLSGRGKKIAPLSGDVYRAFQETKIGDLKAIIVGMGPYHTMKDNKVIADGLALSCSHTLQLQPSLENWYKAIEKELVKKDERSSVFRNPDLKFLANQGVMLFNASLTCEMFKAGSHLVLWEPFMKYVFEEIFAISGVPILYLGKEAQKLKKYSGIMQWGIEVEHPAAASYKGVGDWDNKNCFSQINKIVKDANGGEIQWYEKLPF